MWQRKNEEKKRHTIISLIWEKNFITYKAHLLQKSYMKLKKSNKYPLVLIIQV